MPAADSTIVPGQINNVNGGNNRKVSDDCHLDIHTEMHEFRNSGQLPCDNPKEKSADRPDVSCENATELPRGLLILLF